MACSNSKKTSRKQRVVNPARARHGAKSNGRDRASTLAPPVVGSKKSYPISPTPCPQEEEESRAQRATHRQTQFPAPHPRPHNNLFSPPLAPSHATPRNLPR
ncbi:hypothetical protein COCSADRAFT_274164 [Bipolaris sorokiniana ND90Pr]|uniref:Uncharacterized protein n=1 Tax=Cochliobolus sativus (strain ND90Pr / ATCC 201652) TaxID=665912 RepID=M2T292_COCSN|nr:uncharacterized protein COCSADRAFT_274164 [Bipolaris sorokiniana ND90Pr]EMD68585.1 hypothetical protein COCSADRAFT_274164 [Bipolaris sorokiniana ND90Pr]